MKLSISYFYLICEPYFDNTPQIIDAIVSAELDDEQCAVYYGREIIYKSYAYDEVKQELDYIHNRAYRND